MLLQSWSLLPRQERGTYSGEGGREGEERGEREREPADMDCGVFFIGFRKERIIFIHIFMTTTHGRALLQTYGVQ